MLPVPLSPSSLDAAVEAGLDAVEREYPAVRLALALVLAPVGVLGVVGLLCWAGYL